MSTTIAESALTQPKKICESSVKPHLLGKLPNVVTKRVRVPFGFTPVPEFIERELETPALEKLYRIIMRCLRRGVSDPSIRMLAKTMKRSLRTVQRYIRALVRLGKLIVQERRITRDRNATNIYILPDLQGGVGDKNVTEKLRADLKTTAPTPAARVQVSDPDEHKTALRKFWEARFAQDRRDSSWRRELYQRKGAALDVVKGWGLGRAVERTRMAIQASVGVFTGETTPMTAEEWAEYDCEMAKLDAKRAARMAR